LLLVACGGGDRPASVILVSIDTLTQAALRSAESGSLALPEIAAFAASGVRFESAHSTSSWTLPAHASLLTGLYPDRTGATDGRVRLSAEVVPLAAALAEAGFETVAFTEAGYVGRAFGFERGFARYDDWAEEGTPALALPRDGRPATPNGAALFDRVLAFLAARDAAGPAFFLFVHTYALHDYFRLRPWTTSRAAPYDDLPSEDYLACLTGVRGCEPAQWQRLEALYRAELEHVDEGFGRLLEKLQERGLAESTLVVLVSDHGEGFDADRGRIHHSGRLHPDLVRIPLVFRGPGLAPRSLDEPVSLVDVMPTLLDWLGIQPPEDLDGRSLGPLLRGAASPPPRVLFAMDHAHFWHDGQRRSAPDVRRLPLLIAAIRGPHWLIQGPGGEELYDVSTDPDAIRNLTGEPGAEAPEAAGLRAAASARGRQPRASSAPVSRDALLQEQLRALGYLAE
jgi:arylsulfatase A-like enzyme